jgi:predicted phage terminase large subunit-like protein
LTPQELDELDRLLLSIPKKGIEYSPHKPWPKQQEFLSLQSFEALFGGAAGPGKSDAILMSALEYVHEPGYAALILRKTFKDLAQPGAIMDRAKSWFIPQGIHWSAEHKKFTFPSGATLTFGHLDAEDDVYQFQGAELQFIGFDELTQFSESQYTYLLSRCRRTKEQGHIPLRVRAASNPGGKGHVWVKERFVSPGCPSRPFVPAVAADNPSLDVEEYDAALSLLTPLLRAQLQKGDWDAIAEGDFFNAEMCPVVGLSQTPYMVAVVRAWDLGYTKSGDATVGVKMGRDALGHYYVLDVICVNLDIHERNVLMRDTAIADGTNVSIVIPEDPAAGKEVVLGLVSNVFPKDCSVSTQRPHKAKKLRAQGYASQMNAGNVTIVRGPWNNDYKFQLSQFTGDEKGETDDQVDASSDAYTFLWKATGDKPPTDPRRYSLGSTEQLYEQKLKEIKRLRSRR